MHESLHATSEIASKLLQIEAVLMAFGLDPSTAEPVGEHGIETATIMTRGNDQICWGYSNQGESKRFRHTAFISIGASDGRHSLDLELSWRFKPTDFKAEHEPMWAATHEIGGQGIRTVDYGLYELELMHQGFTERIDLVLQQTPDLEAFPIIAAMARWFASQPVEKHETDEQ
tara:strand:+ start:302 stop:820 length:519 start_codon:yes stop_codon:yes gene_type:complete